MNFFDAVQLAKSKEGLIGKTVQGARLDDIVIVPTSQDELPIFQQIYIQTLNAQQAIAPFMGSDVIVKCVYDKSKIRQMGILLLSDLPILD